MLWKLTAALGLFGFLFWNAIAGGVVLILAVLLYMVAQRDEQREQQELQAAKRQAQQRQAKSRPAPEALPADGSMPGRRPDETEAAWAARVQAAEIAAFKAQRNT